MNTIIRWEKYMTLITISYWLIAKIVGVREQEKEIERERNVALNVASAFIIGSTIITKLSIKLLFVKVCNTPTN